jgi:hypothetical protein
MIELTIPETVPTPFVVATAQPPDDPLAVARDRVRLPLAADLLGTSLVRIHTLPTGVSGFGDLMAGAAWARQEERHLLDKTSHHIIVMGHLPPVSQPGHGQATRAIVRALAEAYDGLVYDAWSHQVLPYDFRFGVEHPEFCLADGWLATFISGYGNPRGRRLTTAGLHRFALPELAATGIPPGNVSAAVTLLRCLSVTLLSEHWDWLACNPGARNRLLRRHAWVRGRDVWRFWAAEPRDDVTGQVRVRLTTEPHGDAFPYVAVGPPADFNAPNAEWWNDVVDLAMPYVQNAPRHTAA